jgi:hypothetical protein
VESYDEIRIFQEGDMRVKKRDPFLELKIITKAVQNG